MTITKQDIDAITAATDHAREAARELDRQAAELQAKLKLARGTRRDVRPTVESVLRRRVATPAEIAAETGLALPAVQSELANAKRRGDAVDVGFKGDPRWSWVVGDDGATPELIELIARLIQVRPLSFGELMAATGARGNRISGAMVRLQQNEKYARRIENRGNQARALWFMRSR